MASEQSPPGGKAPPALEISRDLDRRIFYLNTIYDFTREAGPVLSTQDLMDLFLLTVLGTFGATKGCVMVCDRGSRSVYRALRGASVPGSLGFESLESRLYRAFQQAEERRLSPMSTTFVATPREIFSMEDVGFTPETALLFAADDALVGIALLGTGLLPKTLEAEERRLFMGLTGGFMVFLKNARAFETIQALNQDLERTNQDLNRTIFELKEARHQIHLMEVAGARLKAFLQGQMERVGRFRWTDVWLMVIVAVLLALPFNHLSPNGIPLLPKTLFLKAPETIDAASARAFSESGTAVLVDARPEALFSHSRIEGAVHVPIDLFDIIYPMKLAPTLSADQLVVVYGRTVSRHYDTELAHRLLERHDQVRILGGGIEAWRKKGYPVQP